MSLNNEISTLDNFTQIRNDILNNCLLTGREKGVLSYLISKPTGWDFSCTRISNDFGDGVCSIKSSIKALEQEKWLIREKLSTGRMVYTIKYGNIQLFSYEEANVRHPHSAASAPLSNKEDKKDLIKDKASKEAPSKQASKAPAKKYSKKDRKIAKLHYKEVLAANPKTTIKFNKDDWSNAVRLLREAQGYNHKEISDALEFARQSTFWATNAQSIPALRGRSKNGLLKFENLFADFKADTFVGVGPAEGKNEFDPRDQWEDSRRVQICNNITSCLKDKFYDDDKIDKLVELVDTIDHMTETFTTVWRSHREGLPLRFSRGSLHNSAAVKDWDAYPNFFNKKEGREGFIGFKDLQLGSEMFNKFEDWVCKHMRIGPVPAMEDLMGTTYPDSKSLRKAWKQYLKGLNVKSDTYYFTTTLPIKYTNS